MIWIALIFSFQQRRRSNLVLQQSNTETCYPGEVERDANYTLWQPTITLKHHHGLSFVLSVYDLHIESLSDHLMLTLWMFWAWLLILSIPPPHNGNWKIEKFQSSFINFCKCFGLIESPPIPNNFKFLLWSEVWIFSGITHCL